MRRRRPGWGGVFASLLVAFAVAAALVAWMFTGGCG